MPKTRDILLSRKKAARFLDVSVRTVDRWTRENFIPHIRLGGRVLYSKRKLLEWLEGYEIAGKDWETELYKLSFYLPKTEAKLRLRIKKRKRRLIQKIIDLSMGEEDREIQKIRLLKGEETAEKYVSQKIARLEEKIYELIEEEIDSLYLEKKKLLRADDIRDGLYIPGEGYVNKKKYKQKSIIEHMERIEEMEERGLIHKKKP